MQTQDLETYLTVNGFDSRMAPQVWEDILARYGVNLASEPVSRLAVANDTVRMAIRMVSDALYRQRIETANSRKVAWESLPFRPYPNWLQL